MNKRGALLLTLFILLAVCVTAGIFLARRGTPGEVFLVEDTEVDEPAAGTSPPPDDDEPAPVTVNETWISIVKEPLVFYDPENAMLLIDGDAPSSVTGNYFYDRYAVVLEGSLDRRITRRIPVNDGILREIIVSGPGVTLVCERGCFIVFDDNMNAYRLTDPRTAYETIVVIDPGHGGRDEGAVVNGVRERDINLDIVLRLMALFDNEHILLLPTRTDDTDISKDDRYALANGIGDYFISVHNNIDERDTRTHGTKTYFHPHESDSPITSEALALTLQQALSARLASRDRGVERSDDYRVLLHTTIPAALTEALFLSNSEEFTRLTDEDVREDIALALAEAINSLPHARPAD